MRRTIHGQGGMGIAALLFYLLLIIGVLAFILKLGPHYWEYLEVRSVMQDIANDPSLAGKDRYSLAKALDNRLYINYIESVKEKDFKFKRVAGGHLISVKYKVQEHMFANMDVVLTFYDEVKVVKK